MAHLHKQPCHVVYTDYRPTPLQVCESLLLSHHLVLIPLPLFQLHSPSPAQHYAYALGGSGLHLILDERGTFRCDEG